MIEGLLGEIMARKVADYLNLQTEAVGRYVGGQPSSRSLAPNFSHRSRGKKSS
jgi:hypothetical protein